MASVPCHREFENEFVIWVRKERTEPKVNMGLMATKQKA